MNDPSDMNLLVLTGMLMAFCSVAVVRIGLALWGHYKFERAYRKYPRVVKYDQYRTCPSVHTWQEFTLAVRHLDPGKYQVCMDCGSIAGNFQWMVSESLIEQAKEVLRKAEAKLEADRKIQSRVAAIIDHRVTEFILREFQKESNDPTFVTKLLELTEFALKAQDEAIEKVAVEAGVRAISQDGDTYTWPTEDNDLKGNA